MESNPEPLPDAGALPFKSLLDAAADGFVVVGRDGRIVWANRAMEDLFGYNAGELSGVEIELLVPERFRSVHTSHRAGFHAHPRMRPMGLGLDLLGRRKDGLEFPIEISLSPLENGDGVYVVGVLRDVRERKQLEEERNALQIELETERERDRIAMDLHDGIMQDIYASSLTLELALARSKDKSVADAEAVDRGITQLHGVVRDIRSYIFDLRPRHYSGDLAEALSDLAHEFGENSQIRTSTDISWGREVEPMVGVAIYNIAHESLSNIRKHARARRVSLALSYNDGSGRLEIADDGVGFDPSQTLPENHRGLRNMAARARAVKARLSIDSQPGAGTRISVEFPAGAALER